jgi:multiple sugar transport system substrate-binding protein
MERRDALSALAALSCMGACRRADRDERASSARLVVKYQPLGDSDTFQRLLAGFEAAHPGVHVVAQALPSSSDVAHQFFLTALEGGSRDFDLFFVDTIWVAEFAHAGWLADLSSYLTPEDVRRDFLDGAAEAVVVEGRTFAVPWYGDVGILFFRRDLVGEAPKTYADLVGVADRVRHDVPGVQGFVWQGRQYEGLVCNVYEAIWGHGGTTMQDGRVLLDTDEARAALAYLRSLLERGTSPRSVASAAEEDARRTFQDGRAALMRNWPYAWAEAQKEGSPVRGRVGIAPLPTLGGEPGRGTLGGFELAVNAHAPPDRRDLAFALAAHLTSPEANLALALGYGRSPVRRATYADPRLAEGAPLLAKLRPMLELARPRPTTPYYAMISDTLQGEFSAAVTGIRAPAEALRRAQTLVDHIMGEDRRVTP